jgi:hypothetical protein
MLPARKGGPCRRPVSSLGCAPNLFVKVFWIEGRPARLIWGQYLPFRLFMAAVMGALLPGAAARVYRNTRRKGCHAGSHKGLPRNNA